MRTAGSLVLLSLLTLGCDGKSVVPAFGVVAVVDDPQRGPAGPRGAKGDPGPQGPQGEPGVGDSIDGSRLRARYIDGADGSRQPLGDWLDSETGLRCSYRDAEDGKLRCLPDSANYYGGSYLDAECSTPVIWTPYASQLPPPAYGQPVYSGGFVFKTGESIAPPSVIYEPSSNGCQQAQVGVDLSGYYFFAVDVVPPSFFVAGTVVTVE